MATGMTNGYAPGSAVAGADGTQVTTCIEDGVFYTQFPQVQNGQIDTVAFAKCTKIQFDGGVSAGYLYSFELQVVHPGVAFQ